MRRFDTVLFDLDGTLLDTLEDICGAANHTLRELGYPERTLAEMRRFVGNGAEMQMRRALGAGANEETVAKALALYKPYYAAHCQIKTKPYAGVLELMAALKAECFRRKAAILYQMTIFSIIRQRSSKILQHRSRALSLAAVQIMF